MKKRLSVIMALVLVLVSLLGTMTAFADDENKDFIDFYMSLGDCQINAVTYKFNPHNAARFYASGDYPEALAEYTFKYELKDTSNGTVLDIDDDGCWTIGKGSYELTWTNVEEAAQLLEGWDGIVTFPSEASCTVNITVDGEKSKLGFYALPGSSLSIKEEAGYVFNPSNLWVIQLDGVLSNEDYYALPDFLTFNPQYTFEVKARRGAVLTEEELAQPMKEGVYFLTWNNMDEIKALVEASDAEIFNRYEVVFPEEPLTSKFQLTFKSFSEMPHESMDMYGSYGTIEGCPMPTAEDLIYITNKDEVAPETYYEWMSQIKIDYYDETGRKLEDSELTDSMPAGTYIAKWTNFFEFLEMDVEKGWGLQEMYKICEDVDEEVPECLIEIEFEPEWDFMPDDPEFMPDDSEPEAGDEQFGSVMGNGTLTAIFGCTTLICLGVIAVLIAKLKKNQVK